MRASVKAVLLGGRPNPSFNLPLLTTLVPERAVGSGTPTFTRATTAYVADHEGILRQVQSGAARFTGARRVRNRLTYTEAFENAAWTKTNGGTGSAASVTDNYGTAPDGTQTATRLQGGLGGGTTTNDYSIVRQLVYSNVTALRRSSIWAKSNTGSSQVMALLVGSVNVSVTVTTSWQRLSGLGTATDTSTSCAFGTRGGLTPTCSDTLDILVWHPQAETVEGAATDAPGEYVSANVLSAPYHGAGVDGVKYFATTNGNTVASNVVTEATGAAISTSTMLGYLAEGARTNIALYSNLLANGARTAAGPVWSSTEIAGDLVTNGNFAAGDTGWTVGGSVSTATGAAVFTSAAVGTGHLSQTLAGTASTDKYIRVTYTVSGLTAGSIRVRLGSNQFGTVRSADGTYTEYLVMPSSIDGLFLEFYVQTTFTGTIDDVSAAKMAMQLFDNATGPDGVANGATTLTAGAANATIIQDLGTIASAVKVFSIYLKRKTGTGDIDLTLNGGTGWTTVAVTTSWAKYEITATLADPDVGIRIVTSGDEVYAWGAQVEAAAFSSSVIPTTTAATTRNADSLTFVAASNVSGTSGALVCEVARINVSLTSSDPYIGAAAAQNYALAFYTSTFVRVFDGTNSPTFAAGLTFAAGTTHKLASRWNSGGLVTFCNGAKTATAVGSFDGDMGFGTSFMVGGANSASNNAWANLRNVRFYPGTISDASLASLTT